MKRIALFARSSNRRRIEEQLARCRELAASKGLPLEDARILKDRCRRAAGPGTRRPVYAQLLDVVRSGRCDLVLADAVIVLTSDIEEFADLWALVSAGALRLVTVDGVDTGWRRVRQ